MSWVSDYKYRWYELLSMNVVRAGGHLPQHIAFVMDGNRRYAKSAHLRKIDGHLHGFHKLADCLRWCLDLGIREVTTFAFSIENFKRSDAEVAGLLDLAREKFARLLEEVPRLHEHGVRIRIIGNMNLLPRDLQELAARAMLETASNDKLFLNVAFAYTSRDEMTQAVEAVLLHGGAGETELQLADIDECLLEACLYTRHSPAPDLLYRTSGETRISDFLMWQLSTTVLYFTKILWPQITIWHFLAGIFAYQRHSLQLAPYRQSEQRRRALDLEKSNYFTARVQNFLRGLDAARKSFLLHLTATTN